MILNVKYSPKFSQVVNTKTCSQLNSNDNDLLQQEFSANIMQSKKLAETKNEMHNLELIDLLRIEQEKHYQLRIYQIVQTFKLQPIILSLNQAFKQAIMKSIILQNPEDFKQTDLLIKKNNQVICFKSKLYATSSIIIKKYSPSNFQKGYFDMVIFSHKGEVLCSFHNFKKIEKFVKELQIRFRRLEIIFYAENHTDFTPQNNIVIDSFFELKKLFQPKSKIFAIYQYVANDQNIKYEQNDLSSEIKVNGQVMNDQQFKIFCYSNGLIFLSQKLQVSSGDSYTDYLKQICQNISKKQAFNNLLLDHICYGDKKNHAYRAKNQIITRFINCCHQKFLDTEQKSQQMTVKNVKILLNDLIKEIDRLRIKLKKSNQQNNTKLIYKHFPRLMKRGARTCFHCKNRTRYLCIGCSIKHSAKVALCVLCFAIFHQKQNYQKHFPQIVKKSNSKFIPNLQKQVVQGHQATDTLTLRKKKKNVLETIFQKKQLKQQGRGPNQIEQKQRKKNQILKKIKMKTFKIISKYKKMKKFVIHCYKKSIVKPKKQRFKCKIQKQ